MIVATHREIVPSVTDFAVSVTVAGVGITAGAVNSIVVLEGGVADESVPQVGLHAAPV